VGYRKSHRRAQKLRGDKRGGAKDRMVERKVLQIQLKGNYIGECSVKEEPNPPNPPPTPPPPGGVGWICGLGGGYILCCWWGVKRWGFGCCGVWLVAVGWVGLFWYDGGGGMNCSALCWGGLEGLMIDGGVVFRVGGVGLVEVCGRLSTRRGRKGR